MARDFDQSERETGGPGVIHAERRRFPGTAADEARVGDLTASFGPDYTRRVDLTYDYPLAEEVRIVLWDKLCRVRGKVLEPGNEDVALLDNLLLVTTQDLRRKLAEGFGPEAVFASEIFSRWKEINDYLLDAEAFDLSIELNGSLRKQPEVFYETRLALRECQKDLNNELQVPLEKNVLQSVHIEGVTDLCTDLRFELVPTVGEGSYLRCVDAGESPLVGLVAELHDFVKLLGTSTYVWEHEALSAIATVRLADELLIVLQSKLNLDWLGDETKRRKVVMLMAMAVAGHGDQEYPHKQVLKGGDGVEIVEHQGIRVAKIEGFGATNFFIVPPDRETLVNQIPAEIRSDPERFHLAERFMTGVRDEDRKDGCSGYALMKYFLQYPSLAIFEGNVSWKDFVEKHLLASFADNLKTSGSFGLNVMSEQEKKVIYPTMLFAALTKRVVNDFESKQLWHESEWRRWYIFSFDKTAPYVGEDSISAGLSAKDKLSEPGFVDGRKHYSPLQNAVNWLCQAEELWREQRETALKLKEAGEQPEERQKKLSAGKDKLFVVLRNGLQDLMMVDFDHPANQEAVEMSRWELGSRMAGELGENI